MIAVLLQVTGLLMAAIAVILALAIALCLALRRPTRQAGTPVATQSVPETSDMGTFTLATR